MNEIIVKQRSEIQTYLDQLASEAIEYSKKAKSDNTIKSYDSDWNDFVMWCDQNNLDHSPALPETVGLYLVELSKKYKASTLSRRLVAISQKHKASGYESPTTNQIVRQIISGIKRTKGISKDQKSPILTENILSWLDTLKGNLHDKRNKSIILLGYSGAFRRSEIVALNVEDIEFTSKGMLINLVKSKTDQEQAGRMIAIPFGKPDSCPVIALQDWLKASGIESGVIYRRIYKSGNIISPERMNDRSIARIVKGFCLAVGLDEKKYSGHSLRSGHVTQAIENDASEADTMKQTGHKSVEVFRSYNRNTNLFKNNSASKLGL